MERALAEILVKIYTKGLRFYGDRSVNIASSKRQELFHKTLMHWNYCRGVLDGQPTT